MTCGCSSEKSKDDTIDEPDIEIVHKDTFDSGQKHLVKIFSKDEQWKIIKGYFDCDSLSSLDIDKDREVVIGCDKELFINNDTVLIQFIPSIG